MTHPTAPREIDFPYFSLRDGFSSTLLLVSDSPNPMDLTVAVRSPMGETVLAALSIQPQEKLAVDVASLLKEQKADVTGAFAEGSIAVYFIGTIMPLAGQLTMTIRRSAWCMSRRWSRTIPATAIFLRC
jgi:hypothetical protein